MRDSFSPEWVDTYQAADLCGYCRKTIMRAIYARRLRATQHAEHGPWRIRLADLDAWMAGVLPQAQLPARRVGQG